MRNELQEFKSQIENQKNSSKYLYNLPRSLLKEITYCTTEKVDKSLDEKEEYYMNNVYF